MEQRIGIFTFLPSLWRLFLTMLTIVFIAEAAVMFLLPVLLPGADRFVVSTADAAMLTILIAPFLWWFIVDPLHNTALVEHLRATVISRALDGIIIINDQGLVESFNPAAERIFGYQEAEVVGKPMTVMIPERYRDAHRRGLERVRSPGQSETIGNTREVRGLRKHGREFPLELSLASWDTGKGKFHIGILRDITERKQAEEMLRESETRYRTLFEQLPDGALIIDPETGLPIEFNHTAHRQLGYSREEFARLRVFDYEAAENPEETQAHIEKILREGRGDFETRHRTKEGDIRNVRVIVQTIWLSGRPYFYDIFHDITERKQAEATRHALYSASITIQEPLELQERLDRILQVARDILRLDRLNILLADPAGQWLEAVASLPSSGEERVEPLAAIRVPMGPEGGALAMAYRTQQAVVWDGRAPLPDPLRLQPPYDQIEALRSRIFVVMPLVVQGLAIGVLGADQRHAHLALDVDTLEILELFAAQVAMAIEHGRLYEAQRIAAIQLEATVEARTLELHVTNGELAKVSRHKSEFLTYMSHELRTPLNAILGFSELLQDPTFGTLSEKQARYLTHIHASGKHLLALINDLLDLAKVEAGRLDLRPEPFALPEALTAALYEIQPLADHKRLALTLDAETGPATLTADPVRFKQILYNLLSNAVKFTPEGGRITVTSRLEVRSTEERTSGLASHTGEFIELAVTDTGIGIKAEDLPKLFQRFTQLEPAIAKAHHGTGLGLALTKQLVELHEGQIVASSPGEGHGSTFTVRLPLHPPTKDRLNE